MDQEKIDAYNLEQKRKVDEQSAKEVQKDNADGISKTVAASNGMVANIVAQSNKKTQDATKEVGTAVKDAGNSILEAMTSSQTQVAEALNNLVIATVVSKDPQLIQAAKDVTSLISSIAKAGEDFGKSNLNALPSSLDKLTTAIQEMISEDATDVEPDYTSVLDDIKKLLAKDVKEPVVNVSAPNVTVDTSAFEKAIKSLEKTIQANKVVIPQNNNSAVVDAVTSVKNAVEGQRFPVPNYVLPFKDINGAATQVQLDVNGKLPTTASATLSGSAIPIVGATTAVGVGIVDGSGNQITSFGGGTQYADGAARGTATGTVVMGDDGTLIQAITAKTLNTQVVAADTGLVVNATIHGITTAGGGAYVDVKVTPSGAVSVDGTTVVTGTVTTKETRSATPTQTSVSVTTASTSILVSNANRLGATITNEGTAICYTKLGATASVTSYSIQIASGGYYEVPYEYTGAIDGITSASTAQLRITEIV